MRQIETIVAGQIQNYGTLPLGMRLHWSRSCCHVPENVVMLLSALVTASSMRALRAFSHAVSRPGRMLARLRSTFAQDTQCTYERHAKNLVIASSMLALRALEICVYLDWW